MEDVWYRLEPKVRPLLGPRFYPAALAHRAFVEETKNGEPIVLGFERVHGALSRFPFFVFPAGHPRADSNLGFVERLVKFLLWQRGGRRVYVGGPRALGEALARIYHPQGARAFDYHFMGEHVYGGRFEVVPCRPDDVPPEHEPRKNLGRHLDGCRIGFDLGASDRKVSAVIEGEPVYTEEVTWEPRKHSDPEYHYREITAGLRSAAAHLPRVDAIGGSAAGVYVDNSPRVASLFRGVPPERYDEIRNLFHRIQKDFGVPLVVMNDGEVTALAGSMSLEATGVLGVALGSSEAGGYVTPEGSLTDWLNELAFCPVDYSPEAPDEEWSGDVGIGARYFSQQCVFRLAPHAGISIPEDIPDADKLKVAQDLLERGHEGAEALWRTMGIYLGYGLAYYANFYALQHILILGRCTSGRGGVLLLEEVKHVWREEFPELLDRIQIHLPDERTRRVGQAIAAASLPEITPSS